MEPTGIEPSKPIGSPRENPRENKGESRVKPSAPAESIATKPSVQTLSADELTDADFERAIVAAMLDGRGGVAETLAETLKARRHARAGNVVRLPARIGHEAEQ